MLHGVLTVSATILLGAIVLCGPILAARLLLLRGNTSRRRWRAVGGGLGLVAGGSAGFGPYRIHGRFRPLGAPVDQLHSSVGERVPDIRFRLVTDGTVPHLREYRGRVVLLNL